MGNYEQKYKKALERARDYYKANLKLNKEDENLILEDIFLELKESEDERIRKELIEFVKSRGGFKQKYIAWLEKQGGNLVKNSHTDNKEEVGNQNCVKGNDKVEPKFHEGDWLVGKWDGGFIKLAKVIDNTYYRMVSQEGVESYIKKGVAEDNYHKFTINDAKDGDVLVCDNKHGQEIGIVKKYIRKYGGCSKCFETYCFVDWDGIFSVGEYMGSRNIHPATKEQRDLLVQKMREKGYKWYAKKKELTKSQRMIVAEAKEALYGTYMA